MTDKDKIDMVNIAFDLFVHEYIKKANRIDDFVFGRRHLKKVEDHMNVGKKSKLY